MNRELLGHGKFKRLHVCNSPLWHVFAACMSVVSCYITIFVSYMVISSLPNHSANVVFHMKWTYIYILGIADAFEYERNCYTIPSFIAVSRSILFATALAAILFYVSVEAMWMLQWGPAIALFTLLLSIEVFYQCTTFLLQPLELNVKTAFKRARQLSRYQHIKWFSLNLLDFLSSLCHYITSNYS